MSITQVKCRARVEVSGFSVQTPFVQSFNVRKQRGQVSTFDASLKAEASAISSGLVAGEVRIYAGEGLASNLIFTGVCRTARISPCYDDPKYVILSISGADRMSLLQGKRYTRRCRSTKACWVAITGVTREGLKSGKFAFNDEPTIEITKGIQEKADTLTAHAGTSISDRLAPNGPPDANNAKPVPVSVRILNMGSEVGGS
jgi:hypothetical protein